MLERVGGISNVDQYKSSDVSGGKGALAGESALPVPPAPPAPASAVVQALKRTLGLFFIFWEKNPVSFYLRVLIYWKNKPPKEFCGIQSLESGKM